MKKKKTKKSVVHKKKIIEDHLKKLSTLYSLRDYDNVIKIGGNLLHKFPNVPYIYNILGASYVAIGKNLKGIECYRRAIEINPNLPEFYNNMGNALSNLGKLDEAIIAFKKSLEINPNFAEAHNNLGGVYRKKKDFNKALAHFNIAVEKKVGYTIALINQGNCLSEVGDHRQAISIFKKIIQSDPNCVEALNSLGNIYKELGRKIEAEKCYQKAIQINPESAESRNNFGGFLISAGRLDEAVCHFKYALKINPQLGEVYNNLGMILYEKGDYGQAVSYHQKAIKLMPQSVSAHNAMGLAFQKLGRNEEAIHCFNKAIQIDPTYLVAYNNLGKEMISQGKIDKATQYFLKALNFNPTSAIIHYNLSAIKRYTKDDPHIKVMLSSLAQPELNTFDKLLFCFSLGKAYEDINVENIAFDFYLEGNRLKKSMLQYNSDINIQIFKTIKDRFSKVETIPEILPETLPIKHKPIFIVGMPRSGTTLVEQIISSHSSVYGAGESDNFAKGLEYIRWFETDINYKQLLELRNYYYQTLIKLNTGKPIVTDKMPINFRWVGYICNAFPEAKIIHVKRDPIATCWSIFKHLFDSKGNGYAYNIVDIVDYYAMYMDLMNFWQSNYSRRIYTLNYETLTENQFEITKDLLQFCRLEWQKECLEFYKSQRPINTASNIQVRKKMYQGSSDAWKRYEPHLKPMIDRLKMKNIIVS